MTPISMAQAEKIYYVLVAFAGMRYARTQKNFFEKQCFIDNILKRCSEYRIGGHLGNGTKFRNNDNNDGIPYVDCYQESRNSKVDTDIAMTNKHLGYIFGVCEPSEKDLLLLEVCFILHTTETDMHFEVKKSRLRDPEKAVIQNEKFLRDAYKKHPNKWPRGFPFSKLSEVELRSVLGKMKYNLLYKFATNAPDNDCFEIS